jgi:hypothetical protein
MAKLKDHIIKQEEHSRMVREALRKRLNERHEATLRLNNSKHQQEEFLYKQHETVHAWVAPVSEVRAKALRNTDKHQSTQTWSEDMPDLEGQALADAEKQFDYDSWLGEHGIGE